MRDFGVLFSLLTLTGLALWRPWLGVLAMAFFGFLQPHSYAGTLIQGLPVYRILFAATLVGTLFTRDRQLPPRDWRVLFLLGFWLGLLLTTWLSAFPFLAWPKFVEVSGVIASTFLILVLIDTRQKLFFLLTAIALAFALVTIKGGYWAIIHGFSDRVYGPPNSQYYDNNHFAVAAVMTIPLLVLWFRQSPSLPLRLVLILAVILSILAALSSWSRGGVLALGVTLALLLPRGGKGVLVVIPILGAALLALAFFPDDWFNRMENIASYQADESAQGRLSVWRHGLSIAFARPLVGMGFEGWMFNKSGLDWHSAYIEVMAEQGLINFFLWISIILGTLAELTHLAWRFRHNPDLAWVVDFSLALRASLAAYAVGGAFLGIGYWDLLYHLVAAAIILTFLAKAAAGASAKAAMTADRDLGPTRALALPSSA